MQWEGNPNVQKAGQIRPAYAAFLDRFAPMLPGDIDEFNTKAAVIVDNRVDDEMIPHVIGNFHHFLPDWNIHWAVPDGDFGPKELNRVLLSTDFWDLFDEEHILIFQRDTICCQPLDPKFLEYDFIGAPCGFISPDKRAFDMNGGLSLRRRSAMLKALEHTPVPEGMPEDVFFSRVLRKMSRSLDARIPDLQTACQFSVESGPYYRGLPFGVHGTDKHYHSDDIAIQIVNQVALKEAVTA